MNSKRAAQRADLIARRRAVDPQLRHQWDREISSQVVQWCQEHKAKIAGVYSPIQGEPSLFEVFPQLRESGIQLALPAAVVRDQGLRFALWKPGDELMKDHFGVLVPLESARLVQPDVLFIPCVGYTPDGYRLGYGGGYFDRTLAARPKPRAVGIAYRMSRCELDVQPHDIALDCIITNL